MREKKGKERKIEVKQGTNETEEQKGGKNKRERVKEREKGNDRQGIRYEIKEQIRKQNEIDRKKKIEGEIHTSYRPI